MNITLPAGLLHFTYISWSENSASSCRLLLLSRYLRNTFFLSLSLSWEQSGPMSWPKKEIQSIKVEPLGKMSLTCVVRL